MSEQSYRGIGLALLGWMGGSIMNLIAWLVPNPPTWLTCLGWVLLVVFSLCFIYGLLLIIISYRKTRSVIQDKDNKITEQDLRLTKLRERLSEPSILEIPSLLNKINDLNRIASSDLPREVTKEQLESLASRIGFNTKVLVWLFNTKNMGKLLNYLITVSTEMDSRNLGLMIIKNIKTLWWI
ncbi:hypothetical protein ACFLW0_01195 [Chloroflexota bacterium]